MNRPVIFCDCFGVVVSEIVPVWMERFFPPEEAAVLKKRIFDRADIGLITEEEAYRELSELTTVPAEQIREELDGLIKVNRELVSCLIGLKKDHRVYMLSNAMSPHLNRILTGCDLYPAFDRVFISSEMKRIKPDPAFYTYVLDELGVDPALAVMIDDNPVNIRGAEEAGIRGIVYRNNEQLFSELSGFLHEYSE